MNKLNLPDRISGLEEMAFNLWWTWHPSARNLFKRLDRPFWKKTGHNPIRLLQEIPYHRLVACAGDPAYLEGYDTAVRDFHNCLKHEGTWFAEKYPEYSDRLIAYFSLEFAVHNSLPLYAGGLGVLAGDYCKEASDLGIPIVGVGFMYPQGYFHQHIAENGWQVEVYEQLNFDSVPLTRVIGRDGRLLTVQVPLDSTSISVAAWQLNLGRVQLYLLDTNLDENAQDLRGLSARLYGGDRELRILQELVIGLGGVRLLRALGHKPSVWHANEGHSCFMMVERIKEILDSGASLKDAVREVKSSSVFTTHTPLPAGNDTFPAALIDRYFHHYWDNPGMTRDEFMQFGTTPDDPGDFNMTVLGLKLAGFSNGVSKLHGQVCRRMWNKVWPGIGEENVPITAITNGVHLLTWAAPQIQRLFARHMGEDWMARQDDTTLWDGLQNLPDEILWAMHRWLKLKLISNILDRARQRWTQDGVSAVQPLAMGALLDTEALTIGFSRRFTGYKRATVLFRDMARLKKILRNDIQPVQIIFAGKAHPRDDDGKRLIQQVYSYARDPEFGGRIAFVEDYDLHMARDLVAGVDVWLNTPRVLMEASGTSGQKASVNGVINLSVLDGWWFEGYNGQNGWAVDEKDNGDSDDYDVRTANAIYKLLEDRVIPLYYDRDALGTPHGWTSMMKETMRSVSPFFNTSRMAKEYVREFYVKAIAAAIV